MRYSRDASNEIYSQFRRLPNPDLVMYVFPHLAGSEQVPVPGYSTVFPLYQRTQYAMPGESARPNALLEDRMDEGGRADVQVRRPDEPSVWQRPGRRQRAGPGAGGHALRSG
ncbi:TIGR03751 family conjugal transfer lipoprotein [Halomonas sp. E19]|uniref:TIGR03751 family conjugal transfer lipoprotein n=1 Tax=Halomonas sp. E19 TaxID=3397247 RepID=UPI004034745E